MTLKEFSKLFYSLALQLRAPEMQEAELRAYYVALKDEPLPLVHAAAQRFMNEAQWFPKTSEWRQAMRVIEHERRELQREASRREGALCAICEDTGWAAVTVDGVRSVSRCRCWTDRRAERLGGVAPPPPALPPVPSGSNPEQLAKIRAAVLPFVKGERDERDQRAPDGRPGPTDSGTTQPSAPPDRNDVNCDPVTR